MMEAVRIDIILLDNGWRPVARVRGDRDWRIAVRALLQTGGRWIAVEQRRPRQASATPVKGDYAFTRALHRRLRPLDIGIADHVIHAGREYFSFRAAGLL
ncbi:MAG: JAB domain-containing protein [Sphingobium sp.]